MQTVTKIQFDGLKRVLRAPDEAQVCECPVWKKSPARCSKTPNIAEPKSFWSPRAGGVFTIPAGVQTNQTMPTDEAGRKRISSWIWEKNTDFDTLDAEESAEIPALSPDVIKNLTQRAPLTVEQRIDRALHAIGKPPNILPGLKSSGDGGLINESQMLFCAATEIGSADSGLYSEINWVLRELAQEGLIRPVLDAEKVTIPNYMLTLKGLNRLETGGEALVSQTAFVAMWFNPEVEPIYKKCIAPAIREAKFEPVRIDRKDHVNKIDDEIVAEIRRARFLVCDFTCGLLQDPDAESDKTAVARGGVYYEAGFAHGLGKKVIWTCRRDLLDHVHFDIRQYNFILWDTGKEKKLRQDLFNRIRAEIV